MQQSWYNKLMRKKRTGPIDISRISLIILLEIFVGFFASILSLYVFIELSLNIHVIHDIDVYVSESIYLLRTSQLTTIMFAITRLGQEYLLLFLGIISGILFIKKKFYSGFFIVSLIGIASVGNIVLKEFFARPRPDLDPIVQEILYSFPSLHAMNAFVFYSALVIIIFRLSRSYLLSLASLSFALIIIVLVGFSRIYLGVHYPTDILAGYIAGFWLVVTALLIEKTITFSRSLLMRST
jgi:undecaprenyl-diphosphatase